MSVLALAALAAGVFTMAYEPSSLPKQRAASIERNAGTEPAGGPKSPPHESGDGHASGGVSPRVPGEDVTGAFSERFGVGAAPPVADQPQGWRAPPDRPDSGVQLSAPPEVKTVTTPAPGADVGNDEPGKASEAGEPFGPVSESVWGSATVPRDQGNAADASTGRDAQAEDEDCLPDGLKTILGDLRAKFGDVTVVSTRHLHTDNHAPGSPRSKIHAACLAIDIRTPSPQTEVVAFLRGRPGIGSVQAYRNKVIHLDAKGAERTAMRPTPVGGADEQPGSVKAKPRAKARTSARSQLEQAPTSQPNAEKPADELPWPLNLLRAPEAPTAPAR